MSRTQINASLIPSAQQLANYKRPQLGFGGVTAVGLDNYRTDGINNWTQIIFSDGNWREESNTTRRTFVITRNAVLTNTGAQSGLRSGLSETNNTWYALYAVKISDSDAGFVTVGDTTTPSLNTISTLNSRYGTNGWLYLGMIRNGDNQDFPGDILSFTMAGNYTCFTNVVNPVTAASAGIWNGMELVSSASAISVSWTYAVGTGATQIPDTLENGIFHTVMEATANGLATASDAPTRNFDFDARGIVGNIGMQGYRIPCSLKKGIQLQMPGAAGRIAILLSGFYDNALGVGSNPQIGG